MRSVLARRLRVRRQVGRRRFSKGKRVHFGEWWWSDWYNRVRYRFYSWQNPEEDRAIAQGSLNEPPAMDIEQQNAYPYWLWWLLNSLHWLGLRHRRVTEGKGGMIGYYGVHTPRAVVQNMYREDIPVHKLSRNFRDSVRPALVVVHDRWGVTQDVMRLAKTLETHGFTVAVPELFRGKRPCDEAEAREFAEKLDVGLAVDDIDGVIADLRCDNPFRSVGGIALGRMGGEVALAAHAELFRPEAGFDGLVLVGCGSPPGNKRSDAWRASHMENPVQCHLSEHDSVLAAEMGTDAARPGALEAHRRAFCERMKHAKSKGNMIYRYSGTDYGMFSVAGGHGDGTVSARGGRLALVSDSTSPSSRLLWDRILAFLRDRCKPFEFQRPNEELAQADRDGLDNAIRILEHEGEISRVPVLSKLIHPRPDDDRGGRVRYEDPDFYHWSKDRKYETPLWAELASKDTKPERRHDILALLNKRSWQGFDAYDLKGWTKKRFMKNLARVEAKKAQKSGKLKHVRTKFWESKQKYAEALGLNPDPRVVDQELMPEYFADFEFPAEMREKLPPRLRKKTSRELWFGDGSPPHRPRPEPTLQELQRRRNALNAVRPLVPREVVRKTLPPPPPPLPSKKR